LFDDKNEQEPINVERLCGNSMFISDTDASSAKTKKHQERIDLLGEDKYLITPGREIENTLSIKSIVEGIQGFSKSADYDLEPEVDQMYRSRDGTYTNSKYKFSLMGSFIDDKLSPVGNIFAEKNTLSTIKSGKKNNFSFYSTKNMVYEDLTKEAINFTEKI
jgi:hypothetical protein